MKKSKPGKPPTEAEILSATRNYLRQCGWYVVRHQQGLGSHRGLSDLVAIKGGKVLWVEIKAPKGVLSEHQVKFRDEIVSHGGTYVVINDFNEIWQDVDRIEAGLR